MKSSCISLITDFGLCDEYVGVMKGVIAGINPHAKVIDISHEVCPQNIIQAAHILCASYAYFPKNTVHLAVVDPGVGTDRRIIAIASKNHFFVAPDNGILSLIINRFCRAVHVTRSDFFMPKVSTTFHARDIFAPVAAILSKNEDIKALGDEIPIQDLITIPNIDPILNNQLVGTVIMADRFGNLITNISEKDLDIIDWRTSACIHVGNHTIFGISTHYMQVEKGESVALMGSKGLLEISVNCGNAKQLLGVNIDDKIFVTQNKGLTKEP
ncbi:MAG: hypothetical protein OMM_02406 [Candidatus Magnetoglobus multicellularis str. Araruama]|uniref:SAM-dependent chlorinase/fluorinase n=1 Tax=Candidatus Magnetoglobus multicellularis str. Araruama TaxID=890399 RepID=A0A1V1P9M4_9BACT|nr:MAG: hypothetical protein OMM_02406 [Candidatus Magnetoglobus multicellularis str. Araruama]